MRIKTFLIVALIVLSGVWMLADSLLPQPLTYFSFRAVFMQYSGVLSIGVMSLAMFLALLPRCIENLLHGLDKMYRLHKWLGISALCISIAHWWMGKGTKWMVGWGWLIKPKRDPSAEVPQMGALEAWFDSQRGFAETVGEWAFYVVAIMLVLALVKRFPYHLFAKTHKWISLGYLVFVFHSVVLVEFSYWSQPVGWVVAVLMLMGTFSAIVSLFDRIGASRKSSGTIEHITQFPALNITETQIQLAPSWQGHQAGQFAFVTSDKREGAHPYTIASAWNPEDRYITFITKALGDHTSRIPHRLKTGMPVVVEGPYGCFTFEDGLQRQIWIGAGIGITPFIARLKHLAAQPSNVAIDLFHPTAALEEEAMQQLENDARAAGVTLHIIHPPRDGYLDADKIRAIVPDWESASIWFCGPAGFGQALRTDFMKHGLPRNRFYQELFEMR